MMCAKFFIFLCLTFAETYAQLANLVDCGKVNIPPMTPAQLINPLSWTLPGQIAASNCYTGFLVGSANALNDMYNAMYTAGPPSATSGVGAVVSVPGRGVSSRSKGKKNNDSKSKKDNESGKKGKDSKKKESSSGKQ